jgi:hypothetical protein
MSTRDVRITDSDKSIKLHNGSLHVCFSLAVDSRLVEIIHSQLCLSNRGHMFVFLPESKVKVKFTLEQATKVQSGSRCIALHFL